MLGFRILKMYKHGDGFAVAEILSHYDQKTYVVHNRFGAWHIGDPNSRTGPMKECATIDIDLAGALQHRYRQERDKLKPKFNPFTAKAKSPVKKENPFTKKAKKTNLFVKKAKSK